VQSHCLNRLSQVSLSSTMRQMVWSTSMLVLERPQTSIEALLLRNRRTRSQYRLLSLPVVVWQVQRQVLWLIEKAHLRMCPLHHPLYEGPSVLRMILPRGPRPRVYPLATLLALEAPGRHQHHQQWWLARSRSVHSDVAEKSDPHAVLVGSETSRR